VIPVVNQKFDLLYGMMLGDGSLCKSGRGYFVTFCGHIEDDLEQVNFFAAEISKIIDRKVKVKLRPEIGIAEVNISCKELFNLFKSNGFPVGKKGVKLMINYDCGNVNDLIKGYFATDGCLVLTSNNGTLYPRLEFSSISFELLNQVKVYLDKLKIIGSIYVSKKASKNTHTLYRLQINGKKKLDLFKEKIGFHNIKHQKRYNKYKNAGGGI